MTYAGAALLNFNINSKIMKDFLIYRANQNPNMQNEHVYLSRTSRYFVIQDPNTYYIFPETMRTAMENHPNIGQLLKARHKIRPVKQIPLVDFRPIIDVTAILTGIFALINTTLTLTD